jgi:4-amino-4-deoxy-L-arabinose transferase-like glycosyltransferase
MTKKASTKNSVLEKKQHDYKWYLLFMIIAFIFYGNSIKNGYSIDDELVTSTDVQKNALVERGISGFVKIFRSRYANDGKQSYDYRPITTLSFAVEHSIVGESPNTAHISHFVSVFLYGFCGIVLFLFLQQLFKGEAKWFSAFVVLLYLIHPIHTEIVDNIKTRDELLAMIFCFGSAIYVFKYYDKRQLKFILIAALLFTLGYLSRPSAKVFLGLIPLSLYFFRDIKIKKIIIVFLGIFVLQFVIKFFSKAMLTVANTRNFEYFENPLHYLDFSHRIPMFFYSIIKYIQMLAFPYPLKYYYGYNEIPLIGYSDWQFFVGIAVV